MAVFFFESSNPKMLALDFRSSLRKVVSFRKAQIVADMLGASGVAMISPAIRTKKSGEKEEIVCIMAEDARFVVSGYFSASDGILGTDFKSYGEKITGFLDCILDTRRCWPKSSFLGFSSFLEHVESLDVSFWGSVKFPVNYQDDFWAPCLYTGGLPITMSYVRDEEIAILSGLYQDTKELNLKSDFFRFGVACLDAMAICLFPVVNSLLWTVPSIHDVTSFEGLSSKFFLKYALDVHFLQTNLQETPLQMKTVH